MKKTVLPLAFILVAVFLYQQNSFSQDYIEVSDTIWSDVTWSADTVKVMGDIHVVDDVTLTIKPGTYVEFQGPYLLDIQGTLIARGAPGDSIIFTAKDTSYFSNRDSLNAGWKGIQFDNSSLNNYSMNDNDTSVINHCIIEFSKNQYGTIYIGFFSSIIISHNHIKCNQSQSYGGAILAYFSEIDITDNLLSNNYARTIGGAIMCFGSTMKIANNVFLRNECNMGGAIASSNQAKAQIVNNVFANNKGVQGGIAFFLSSSILFQNNLIVNNFGESGIVHAKFTELNMINSTLSNNYCNNFGTISLQDSHIDIYNSIIWGNASFDSSLVSMSGNCSADIYYSNLKGGQSKINNGLPYEGAWQNNFDLNPQFISPTDTAGLKAAGTDGDWTVSVTSPCINAGSPPGYTDLIYESDLAGNERILNRRVDIGAYEYHLKSIEVCGPVTNDTVWFADTVKITCDVVIEDDVTVTINPGTIIQAQGHYSIEVDGTIRSIGTEEDMIVFTVYDTTGFSDTSTVSGGWGGLEFAFHNYLYDNDTTVFDYTIIEYGKKIEANESGGGIYISNNSKIRLSNSTIRNCFAMYRGGALFCTNAQITIQGCSFENNISGRGGGLYIYNSNLCVISNTRVMQNEAWTTGGGMEIQRTNLFMDNGLVCKNSAPQAGGIFFYLSEINLSSCRITNNTGFETGGAMYMSYISEESVIENTLIANNTSPEGGAVYTNLGSNPVLSNATVVNNSSGFRIKSSSPLIGNSIIWGNGDYEVFLADNNSAPVFRNCNIQYNSSGFALDSGVTFAGQYINNIDTIPLFIDPAQGTGIQFNALEADWQLSALSPCINKGDNTFYAVPGTDLMGNPRLNGTNVDIGAYENQDDKPEIITQPANISTCLNDSINFQVEVDGPANFQWFRDGKMISGENNQTFVISPVEFADGAGYHCIVDNAYGKVTSNIVLLIVKSKPDIITQTSSKWIIQDEDEELQVLATGAQPIQYQWFKNDIAMQGETGMKLKLDLVDYPDEGNYKCILSNNCGETGSDPVQLWMAPQICMVTVSTISGNNLVVWEKNSSAPIVAYNIYRESAYAGIYDKLTTLDADDYSIFIDTTANPTIQAYFYKITGTDTAGNETSLDLCKAHKTVHLLVTTNPETKSTQLNWDRYIGFDYGTYVIFKSETGTGFEDIHNMASSSSTWSDPIPVASEASYRVAALRPIPCVPTGNLKGVMAESGPYSHAMSNIEDNRLQTSDIVSFSMSKDGLLVFPNPFSERATLQFSNPDNQEYRVIVRDLAGKAVIIINNVTSNQVIIERNTLKSGYYTVEVSGDNIFRSKIIIE